MPALAAPSVSPRPRATPTAISLNEDPTHFFGSRIDHRVTGKELIAWVDQYAGTQVRELILNVNAQRTSFASTVWTPLWKGYDPQGPDDQPLFASLPPDQRKFFHAMVHTAWQMNQDGLDQFRIWARRAREKGISPWLSIRMNDLHNVDDERHPLHSDFWRAHPELRRIPYRGEMRDKALDFGREEVREYTFRLIDEVVRRYDFDGLELDWMRFGFHFAPGREADGREHLNRFMARVRKLVGPRKKIGVRVPPHPESALGMGLDAVAWARAGCADVVVPTNFWRTVDTNMPLRLWRQLLPESCQLGGGIELGLNPYMGSRTLEDKPFGYNDLKTVRGAAAAMLEQGAARVYLFNYMDSQTAIEDLTEYPKLLREVGAIETLRGKERRHIVTYTDTWAPGEATGSLLPARLDAGAWRAFRIATGPVDAALKPVVRIGVTTDAAKWTVRLNGVPAAFRSAGKSEHPGPKSLVYTFDGVPSALRAGDTVVEVTAVSAGAVEWVEVALVPA
jgi:hypothetical protein